jgi:hypothetical protein
VTAVPLDLSSKSALTEAQERLDLARVRMATVGRSDSWAVAPPGVAGAFDRVGVCGRFSGLDWIARPVPKLAHLHDFEPIFVVVPSFLDRREGWCPAAWPRPSTGATGRGVGTIAAVPVTLGSPSFQVGRPSPSPGPMTTETGDGHPACRNRRQKYGPAPRRRTTGGAGSLHGELPRATRSLRRRVVRR